MSLHFDVIVIGTGGGGGSLLHRLAPSGRRILVLERGPFLPREKDNWSYHGSFKYYSSETMYNKAGGENAEHRMQTEIGRLAAPAATVTEPEPVFAK